MFLCVMMRFCSVSVSRLDDIVHRPFLVRKDNRIVVRGSSRQVGARDCLITRLVILSSVIMIQKIWISSI